MLPVLYKESVGNIYGFTGRESDEESPLYYYRARYYSPESGRFISEDIIGEGIVQSNHYKYAKNNPMLYIDANGLSSSTSGMGQVGTGEFCIFIQQSDMARDRAKISQLESQRRVITGELGTCTSTERKQSLTNTLLHIQATIAILQGSIAASQFALSACRNQTFIDVIDTLGIDPNPI